MKHRRQTSNYSQSSITAGGQFKKAAKTLKNDSIPSVSPAVGIEFGLLGSLSC